MAWRCFSVNSCELTVSVTAPANALAAERSQEELSLLAAVLTQLGDTLATIAVQRSVWGKKRTRDGLLPLLTIPSPRDKIMR